MKTMKQIANEIGVTKQAVHQRMKRDPLLTQLQGLTQEIDGVIQIDVDGESLIKSAFAERKLSTSTESVDINSDTLVSTLTLYIDTKTESMNEYINSLKDQNAALKTDKDNLQNELNKERKHSRQQAEMLAELSTKLAELTRNSQVLLKQEQEKTAFILPERSPTASSKPDASGMKSKRPFWQFWKK